MVQMAKTAFPKFKPMLVPPVPWRKADLGAHLTVRAAVMRTREQRANMRLLGEADRRAASGGLGCQQVGLCCRTTSSGGCKVDGRVCR